MELTLIAKSRMLVMRIYGEIDHHTAGEIRKRIEREIKRTGAVNIAFDFGRVTFMDSSGIGMILGRYKTVQALGGYIVIYDASEQIIRLLEMAGLKNMIILSDSLQHGINEINKMNGVRI
ncbi:MAG: anti-sigma factor antagonist [Oscillospiraceae bacterium]|nr:anti-sigma factor antagonist [Oscillospiraceae bacterium]